MPITLTCDCGARFEADDRLAGQQVHCPECHFALRAPGRAATGPRTSLLALLALVVALVGAFTLVGGAVAACLAGAALVQISRHRGALSGKAFALAALAVGAVGSGLAVALLSAQVFPGAGLLREWVMTGQLEALPAPQVGSRGGELVLTVSQERWAKVRSGRTADPVVGELQDKTELLLMLPRAGAFLDVLRLAPGSMPDGPGHWVLDQLGKARPPLFGDDDGGNPMAPGQGGPRAEPPWVGPATAVPAGDNKEWEVEERAATLRRGSSKWQFLVRTYRRVNPGRQANVPTWVVRAYAPARRFAECEADLREALDSVRLPQ